MIELDLWVNWVSTATTNTYTTVHIAWSDIEKKTRTEYDKSGRTFRIIYNGNGQKTSAQNAKKEIKLFFFYRSYRFIGFIFFLVGFQEELICAHIVALHSGGANEDWKCRLIANKVQIFSRIKNQLTTEKVIGYKTRFGRLHAARLCQFYSQKIQPR